MTKTRITFNLSVQDAVMVYQSLITEWLTMNEHSPEAIRNQEIRLRILKQLTEKGVNANVPISKIYKESEIPTK